LIRSDASHSCRRAIAGLAGLRHQRLELMHRREI
jgi:hypothetical protein